MITLQLNYLRKWIISIIMYASRNLYSGAVVVWYEQHVMTQSDHHFSLSRICSRAVAKSTSYSLLHNFRIIFFSLHKNIHIYTSRIVKKAIKTPFNNDPRVVWWKAKKITQRERWKRKTRSKSWPARLVKQIPTVRASEAERVRFWH